MAKTLVVGRRRTKSNAGANTYSMKSPHPLVGKTAYVKSDDGQFLIVCQKVDNGPDGSLMVFGKLAVPNRDGLIIKTATDVEVSREDVSGFDGVVGDGSAKAFDSKTPFSVNGKALEVKDDSGVVTDYQNVRVSGLASTFQETTPRDRDGDYIVPGAFDGGLKDFRKNPVMLLDHTNRTTSQAGSFDKIAIAREGLLMEGSISNSPFPDVKHARFLVAEGHLKAFSIGGVFIYGEDGFGIEEVRLFETSLIPVPANQDALFTVKGVDVKSAIKCFSQFQEEHVLQFK